MDEIFILRTIFALLITSKISNGIFFDDQKKVLTDILHSIKEKKDAVKISKNDNIYHHYHLHYYPVPINLVFNEQLKISPTKHQIDHLHREELKSLGWTDHEYKNVPEPEIIIPITQHHHESIPEPWLNHNHHRNNEFNAFNIEDQLDIAALKQEIERHSHNNDNNRKKINNNSNNNDNNNNHNHQSEAAEARHQQTHISFHLPFHQEIILNQASSPPPPPPPPPEKEEIKLHPLISFFQKLQNIKNNFLNFHNDDKKKLSSCLNNCEDKIEMEKPVSLINSKVKSHNDDSFAIYFHPKKFANIFHG